jgi:hypothetical protein
MIPFCRVQAALRPNCIIVKSTGDLLKRGPGQYKVTGADIGQPRPSGSLAGSFFNAGGGGGAGDCDDASQF